MIEITSARILKFASANPQLWHEGLDKKDVKKIKKRAESDKSLFKKFYWPQAKSYIFQDILDDNCYCITKEYYNSI